MKVEVKQGEGLIRDLSIEIPPETVQSELEKKFADIKQSVALKGFRKGHAPLGMIKSLYGDQAKADVVDKLIKESYPAAIREKTLKVASKPTVTALDFTDEGALMYTARVEVLPEVDKVRYDGLELQTVEIEVTDEEVDEVVEHLRKQFSELRPLDREAAPGDVVIADLEKIADPKMALATSSFPDSHMDLGNPLTVKEFKEQLPGVKAGDEKEIEVTYADDYPDAKFAGARITYRCCIKSVNQRIMPDFNDEFAKRLGQTETALEQKLKIRHDIKRQKEETQRRTHKREIVRQICRKNEVQIPESLISDYLDSIVKDLEKSADDFDEAEIRERYRPIGTDTMRWDLLWHILAEQEKIEVLPSDTENWIVGFANQSNITVEQARENLNRSGRVNQLRESILEEKVLSFLIGTAKMVPTKE